MVIGNKHIHGQPWLLTLLLIGLFLTALQTQAALTPAGTRITNLATVTYEDGNGNQYSAQSNESVVTVAEVYAPELKNPQTKMAAPGQPVYFPHQLSNLGNTADTFNLSILDIKTLSPDNIKFTTTLMAMVSLMLTSL